MFIAEIKLANWTSKFVKVKIANEQIFIESRELKNAK